MVAGMLLAKYRGMSARSHTLSCPRIYSSLACAASMLLAALLAVGLGRPPVEISLDERPHQSPIRAPRFESTHAQVPLPELSMAALLTGRCFETLIERMLPGAALRFGLRAAAAWRRTSGDAPLLPRLLDDCADREWCRQVIGAPVRIGDPSTAAALVARPKDPILQRDTSCALGQTVGPEAVVPLVDCLLHHESSRARIEAARALRLIGGPLVKYSLCHAALDDPELTVREAAFSAWMDLAGSGMRGGHTPL